MAEQFNHGAQPDSSVVHYYGRSCLVIQTLYFSGLPGDAGSHRGLAAMPDAVIPRGDLSVLTAEDAEPRHGEPYPASASTIGRMPYISRPVDGEYMQVRSGHGCRLSRLSMEMPRRAVHGLGGANVQVPRRKA